MEKPARTQTEFKSEQLLTDMSHVFCFMPPLGAYIVDDLLSPDDEIRKLGIPEADLEQYRRAAYQNSFGLDSWLDKLQHVSFRTEYVDVTYDEGVALAKPESKRTDEHKATLKALGEKIDKVIENFNSKAAFVKLNTRSPKDVPIYDFDNGAMQKLIIDEIESVPADKLTDNHIVWAFVKATTKVLKVSSGEEAMRLLMKSTRIKEDLSKTLHFGEKLFSAKIMIREWLDEVADRPEMEFRAFVNNKKLNAMSQYFCFSYSQTLVDQKDEIAKNINNFFDEIKEKIPHTAYVIDFYYSKSGKPLIIELNPFHIGAGAALFSWRLDRELFLNGPFEFRIVEKVPEYPFDIIPLRWQKWLNKRYHPERLEAPVDDVQPDTNSSGVCSIQ